jgi:hypothetical protein
MIRSALLNIKDTTVVKKKIGKYIAKHSDDLGGEIMSEILSATRYFGFSDEAWGVAKDFFKRVVVMDEWGDGGISADFFLSGLRGYESGQFVRHFDKMPVLAGWVLLGRLHEHFFNNEYSDGVWFWCDVECTDSPNELRLDCAIHGCSLNEFGLAMVAKGTHTV